MMTTPLPQGNAYSDDILPTSRPKVLFLAYYFPPLNSSGCVRTWNIAKHLSRLGWEVTVVTPDPKLWRNQNDPIQANFNFDRECIKRIPTGHRWCCLTPGHLKCSDSAVGKLFGGVCRKIARSLGLELTIGWEREAEVACAQLSPSNVDIILVSGPPFIGFKVAKSLSARLGCPYVLDYRDPWIENGNETRWNNHVVRSEQAEIIEASSAVTVVSPSLLKWRFNIGRKEHVISNGFDPEELRDVKPHEFGHFAIVYTGVFYPPNRVITPVMAALRRLSEICSFRKEGIREWKFHYYGPETGHVLREAQAFGITDNVIVHGRVSRAESLSAVRGSGLSVVIASILDQVIEAERYIVTGKLFEALGLNTPVLFIGPPGSDVDQVAEMTGLVQRLPAKDVEGMAAFFQEVMTGKIPPVRKLDVYTWPNLIKQFDNVLRQAILKSASLG